MRVGITVGIFDGEHVDNALGADDGSTVFTEEGLHEGTTDGHLDGLGLG